MTEKQFKVVSFIGDHYDKKSELPSITAVAKKFKRTAATMYEHLLRVGIAYKMDSPKTVKLINKALTKARKEGF